MPLTTPDNVGEPNENEPVPSDSGSEPQTAEVDGEEMPVGEAIEEVNGDLHAMVAELHERVAGLEDRVAELEEQNAEPRSMVEMVEFPCGHDSYDPTEAPDEPFAVTCDECGERYKVTE